MQQPNNPNTTNPAVEVALIIIAGVLIVIDAVLLYLKTIDIGFASSILIAALSLLGINLAYKAPSPGQQAQQNVQMQSVQQLLSQAIAVLPVFANLLHSHASAPVPLPQQQVQAQPTAPNAVVSRPVAPPQGQQTPRPEQATGTPPGTPGTSTTTLQPQAQQFKPFTPLPEISVPMAAMPQQQPTQQS